MDYNALKNEVHEKCTLQQIEERNCDIIASIVNQSRTRPNSREIGNGAIIETIGIQAGNELLDILMTDATFRHIKPLLEQGRLIISSQLVIDTINQLQQNQHITRDNADKLIALGNSPDPVSPYDISIAVYSASGEIM